MTEIVETTKSIVSDILSYSGFTPGGLSLLSINRISICYWMRGNVFRQEGEFKCLENIYIKEVDGRNSK